MIEVIVDAVLLGPQPGQEAVHLARLSNRPSVRGVRGAALPRIPRAVMRRADSRPAPGGVDPGVTPQPQVLEQADTAGAISNRFAMASLSRSPSSSQASAPD